MPTFGVYQLSDLISTGPDPWLAGSNANSSAPGATTFTLRAGAEPIIVELADGDVEFDDADNSQDLVGSATINGNTYTDGQNFENEYSYGVRPVGSTDPADMITVYSIDEGGNTPSFGIATTGELVEGVVYEIVSIDSNNPSVAYSDLYVCFGKGTRLLTDRGPRPIEKLMAGDRLVTRDDGDQPILWVGGRDAIIDGLSADRRPVEIRRNAFGPNLPARKLVLSPQHRVLVTLPPSEAPAGQAERLVPAKGLLPHRGVRRMRDRRSVTYFNVLLPSHAVIFAEGVPVESLYPAEYALSLLSVFQRLQIHCVLPTLTRDVVASYGALCRKSLRVQKARHLLRAGPDSLRLPTALAVA